jgi:hypothetical protein
MTSIMMLKLKHLLPLVVLPCIIGCNASGFAHDEQLVGPYRLVAVDTDDQMGICWSVPNTEGSCLGDGLPSDTVYAAGFDEKYLVAAVHPTVFGKPINKSETNYYYVIRTPDERSAFPTGKIRGPMNQAQFEADKAALRLPGFSRVFANLH